jgi:hypothetical protein
MHCGRSFSPQRHEGTQRFLKPIRKAPTSKAQTQTEEVFGSALKAYPKSPNEQSPNSD